MFLKEYRGRRIEVVILEIVRIVRGCVIDVFFNNFWIWSLRGGNFLIIYLRMWICELSLDVNFYWYKYFSNIVVYLNYLR